MKQVAPWAVAAAILYYLFSEVPLGEAWRAARDARLELFLPALLASVLLWFWIDSAAFAFIFSRFNTPLSWAEARSLRGMTYLATPINWNLGTAAVILHLRSSKQIGALDSTSTMFLYQTIDGMVLASFVLGGSYLMSDTLTLATLRTVAAVFFVVNAIGLATIMGSGPAWAWLARFRGLGLFRSHRKAVFSDLAVIFALKSLYFAVFVSLFWLGCHAFGVGVPLRLAAAATPAVLMASALPITPAGLGTQQAAMVYFFSPHGEEAAILAFGLTLPVGLILFRCLIGLRYLRDLPRLREEMARAEAIAAEDVAEAAAG